MAPLTFLHRHYALKKHWASRLHYDLRLEWNGSLLSWAVPMGPTRNPGVARKALQMPNHRPENLGFEGVHESGTIMLWDRGTWEPHPDTRDIDAALQQGSLRFILHGEKLEGCWTLNRTNEIQHDVPIWLLSKEEDFSSVEGTDKLLEERSNSVKSGRTREEIDRDWNEGTPSSEGQILLF